MMNVSFTKWSFRLIALALSTSAFPTHSSDLRRVSEPSMPSSCNVLYASGGLATGDIQKALNSCAKGKAVRLASRGSNNVFLTGPLNMPSGVSLSIDRGVVLRAVNKASVFDDGGKTCGTLSSGGKGCKAVITFNNVSNSGIYGEGQIDGQGGTTLSDKGTSWWNLSQKAKNSGQKQNVPRLIQINGSQNITLYKINLRNSPNFHVVFYKSNGLTVWNVNINTPANARNTDGIDPISSKNVTVAYTHISTGDDNVAIKANPNSGSASNMTFLNNTFGSGHGLSIGSQTNDGVYNIDVNQLSMNGTDNGLRIKSDKSSAGEVANVRYNNVTMSNVKNAIVMDTVYENKSGSLRANWHDVSYNNITVKGNSNIIFNGTNASRPLQATMTNMHLPSNIVWKVKNANIKK